MRVIVDSAIMGALRKSAFACVALVTLLPQGIAGQAGSPVLDATVPASSIAAFPSGPSTPLGSRIDALLRDPALAGAHWGIAVTAMDGTPLYGLDEARLFRPASTAKLFTTVVALGTFGVAETLKTAVSFPAPDSEGAVYGDLTFIGARDPNLSARRFPYASSSSPKENGAAPNDPFDELAAGVAAGGVRHVTGNLVVSSGTWDPYPEGWAAEDLPWGYGAPVADLSAADNELKLNVTAASAPGGAATVSLTPDLSSGAGPALGFYSIASTVTTAQPGVTPTGVTVHHMPGEPTLRLSGTLPPGKSYATEVVVDDPPRFAAEILRQSLLAHGVTVEGKVVAAHNEPGEFSFLHESKRPLPSVDPNVGVGEPVAGGCTASCPLRVEHTSPTLMDDITATLKDSLNLHAELMLRNLGTQLAAGTAFTPAAEGARVMRARLLAAGIPDHDFVLYDGSGLSTKDLVTPRAEARLLAYAARQPWFPQWKAALPVGGVDGTLSARFIDPPLRGHVFAKTGTLGESRALAGYVLCASGRELIFAILDDNHEPGSPADRTAMDQIVAAIAANN